MKPNHTIRTCSRCEHLKTAPIIGGTGPTKQRFYLCFFTGECRDIGLQLPPHTSPAWCPRRKEPQEPEP